MSFSTNPVLEQRVGLNILEIFFDEESLAVKESVTSLNDLFNDAPAPQQTINSGMFANFRLYPIQTRPSFTPNHVLFFSGWMAIGHIETFIQMLTTDERDIIRRLAIHDDFFHNFKNRLLNILGEFTKLESLILVNEKRANDEVDMYLGPRANPPDDVDFITMSYVIDPKSSPSRSKVPYIPMDRIHEVESDFQNFPKANWPAPVKVDVVMIKRNGIARVYDYNLYANLPSLEPGNTENEESSASVVEETDNAANDDSFDYGPLSVFPDDFDDNDDSDTAEDAADDDVVIFPTVSSLSAVHQTMTRNDRGN